MFPAALSPIRDTKGDDTVNIVSTPYFPASPLPTTSEPSTDSKVSRRLFENSSVSLLSDWTTDSSSNDWTTDSEAEPEAEPEEPEIEFRWSATP